MKKTKRGYTLIELIVSISFVLVIVITLISVVNVSSNSNINPMFYPEQARAQAQQKLANEMAEQNRLMREQIKLLQEQKK